MNKVDINNDPSALGGLLDIIPPDPPMLSTLESLSISTVLAALLSIVIFLVIGFLTWRYFFSNKGKARRKIARLRNKLISQKTNSNEVARNLSVLLRENLRLTPIIKHACFPDELGAHKLQWEEFIDRLSVACYSPAEKSPGEALTLIDDAYFWLKTWPNYKYG